jgi:CBS domain-containing protein
MKSFLVLTLILAPLASAADLTYEQSSDPALVERCFLAPSDYAKLNTSRISKAVVSNEVLEADATEVKPTINNLLYGQLFDANGDPWGGKTVRIIWEFEGTEKSLTTKTFTLDDARLFGDISFIGYYFFSRNRVGNAEYRVEVVEEIELFVTPVNATPPVNVTQQPLPKPRPVQQKLPPPEKNIFVEFFNKYWRILLTVFGVFFLFVLYQWRFKKAFDKILFRPPKLGRSITLLNKKLTRTFMQNEFPTLSIDASIRDLLAKVVHEDYCIIEKEGQFRGLITAEDLLEPMYKNEENTVANLLQHPRTLTPGTPFGEAALLGTEYRVLPVVKNNVVVGVVTRHQLLTMYDELFSLNPSGVKKVTKLQRAITQAVTISPQDTVETLIERMISEDTSTVVILEEKPSALVTEIHVLEELMDYRDTLHKMTVSSFGGRLTTIEATASLLDANRIMLDGRLRALPVVHKGALVGILTQRSAIHELQAALKDISV